MRTISHPLDLLDHYAMNKKIKRFLIRETTNYLTNKFHQLPQIPPFVTSVTSNVKRSMLARPIRDVFTDDLYRPK